MSSLSSRQGRGSARLSGGLRLLLAAFLAVAVTASAVSLGPAGTGAESAQAAAGKKHKKKKKARKSAGQTVKKGMWGPTALDGQSLFPTYRDLGVGVYNTTARWDQIAPTTRPVNGTDPNDPAYQWPAYLDLYINEAVQYGMQVQVMLLGAPPWANGGNPWFHRPTNAKDYGDFAAAIAKRYPSVKLWMIWGEPNRAPNFQPFTPARKPTGKLNKAQQEAPRDYAEMVDAAYEGLKSASPANKVIAGNTYTSAGKDDINPYQWIRYMTLPDGSRPRMDMWGHNPFGFDIPKLTNVKKGKPAPRGTVPFSDLNFLTRELDKVFKPKLKLYLAEWGVPTGFKDKDLLFSLPPKEAKAWVKAGYRIARTNKRIYSLSWIHPLDTDRSSMGLMTTTGQRKATFKVFKAQ